MSALVRTLLSRITELERRIGGMNMKGRVTDVDPATKKVRFEIGQDEDGNPVKSPWVLVKQRAGALKIFSMPSVGELVEGTSDCGDIAQATVSPCHWTDDNQSPSDDGEIHKLTFGDVVFTLSSGGVLLEAGGVTYRFDGTGFVQQGGKQEHDGKNVGADHKHVSAPPGPPGVPL
jgi:hypothetical protein